MKKTERISLLYYLERGSSPFHLEVTYGGGQNTETGPSSFLVVAETDPLCRVIKGRIVTDAGTAVKDVLLLMQRDDYIITDDPLCPITNLDVERAWQQAFSAYLKDSRSDFLLLSRQMDEAGAALAMAPLFFCNRTTIFFPPPCPQCGLPLEQCEDDELLMRAGLRPYTRSLRRYLYCETCSTRRKLRFYAYKTDSLDPEVVEDRFDLIRRLGLLAYSSNEKVDFVCSTCQFRDECYGIEQKAQSSVIPFAFYPFHMLMVAGPSLNTWNRDRIEEKEDLLAGWEHALRLGWSLMSSVATGQTQPLSKTEPLAQLQTLRNGADDTVVTGGTIALQPEAAASNREAAQEVIPEKTVTNDEVRRLLGEIGKDWGNLPAQTPSPPADTQSDDDMMESVETVFLTMADLGESPPPYQPQKGSEGQEPLIQTPVRTEPLDDMDKTVILPTRPPDKEIDLEKTVILRVGQATGTPAPPAAAPKTDSEQKETLHKRVEANVGDETVIISAGRLAAGPTAATVGVGTGPETGAAQGEVSKKRAQKDEDDLMEATVILKIEDRPKKGSR